MTAETATATDVMPVKEPPATVTVRRSWAVGGLVAVVVVIVAMAIALAAVAGDDGPDGPDGAMGGFPQGPPSGIPEMSQGGVAPPQGMPDQGAMPQLPDMPGQSSQSPQGSTGSQTNP